MILLSGVIITYNEQRNIQRCIDSLVNVVDEIVVVDSLSTDQTVSICHKNPKVRVVLQEFLGYREQKNFAIQQAKHSYIVSLDADEALCQVAQKNILELKQKTPDKDGYYINRYNNFCGTWIKHSNWYPDKKLRVFKKGEGTWKGINPHDSYELFDGKKAGKINGDILHWSYQTHEEYLSQINRFSSISAASYYELGIKPNWWRLTWNPFWIFFRAYFIRLGFLDGVNGLVICTQSANLTFLKYAKLRALYKQQENKI